MGLAEDVITIRIALDFSDDPEQTLTGYERKLRGAFDRLVDAALANKERRTERLITIDERLAWSARHDTSQKH